MLLYELFNDVQFDCVATDGQQHSRFKMVVTVNGHRYEGTGWYTVFFNFLIILRCRLIDFFLFLRQKINFRYNSFLTANSKI